MQTIESYHKKFYVHISSIVPTHIRKSLELKFGFGESVLTNDNFFDNYTNFFAESRTLNDEESNESSLVFQDDQEERYTDLGYVCSKSKISKLRRDQDVNHMCNDFMTSNSAHDLLTISSEQSHLSSSNTNKEPILMYKSNSTGDADKETNKMIQDIMKNLRVVIADDALVDRKFLSKIVKTQKGANVNVSTAENGSECIVLCRNILDEINGNIIDNIVIFMDINMPQKNGFEATKEIRTFTKGFAPYIIGMSSYDTPEYRNTCIEVGMDTFVTKPFTIKKVQTLFSEISLNESRSVEVDIFKKQFSQGSLEISL